MNMENKTSNSIKVTLSEAVKIDGVLVNEISLRRPKVRDLLIASGGSPASESEREVNLIANLAEIPAEIVKDLDVRDYLKIQDVLKSFLAQPGKHFPAETTK
jgi:hypothetical protein